MPKPKAQSSKVMVGLSGGVDSAVSAALLKRAGAQVVGAFIKTWHPEWMSDKCSWRAERRDAMRVAAHLDIPFITVDLEKEYKRGVADYMIAEYKVGRTPNPDVMCNKEIKFGAFLKHALALGADMIATGHYAQTKMVNGKWQMLAGADMSKDQCYFLWTLNQEQLSKTIFPVGHLLKSEVRQLAQEFKLPVAEKRDSQGICFLGNVDMKDFLSHYIKAKPGNVLDEKGKVIGKHDGAVFYTLGERTGDSMVYVRPPENEAMYVLAKDAEANTITIAPKKTYSRRSDNKIYLRDVNWISGEPTSKQYQVRTRYREGLGGCFVRKDGKGWKIDLSNPKVATPGQSVVIYDGDICRGGGVVI
ncbi:MAG TPA: tRNA 2-thiouridine(34) synthase MnmA [Candidatus Paceibacterota bacterium]